MAASFRTCCSNICHLIPGQANLLWPPVLGQKSVRWDQVFALVKRPELLWDCWKPSKSLDQYSLEELWTCYNLGEPVFDAARVQTGIKPPLQLVEQYFQSKWRGRSSGVCQSVTDGYILSLKYCYYRIGKGGNAFVRYLNGFRHNRLRVLFLQQLLLRSLTRCAVALVTRQRRG